MFFTFLISQCTSKQCIRRLNVQNKIYTSPMLLLLSRTLHFQFLTFLRTVVFASGKCTSVLGTFGRDFNTQQNYEMHSRLSEVTRRRYYRWVV